MEHALSNNFSRLFGTLQERHQVILSKGNKASSVLGHFLTTQELILEKRGPFCIKFAIRFHPGRTLTVEICNLTGNQLGAFHSI